MSTLYIDRYALTLSRLGFLVSKSFFFFGGGGGGGGGRMSESPPPSIVSALLFNELQRNLAELVIGW